MVAEKKSCRCKSITGVIVLDKPIGPSSNQSLRQVQRLLGAAKAGHTGTLDPLASGVLPLCFGEATKLSRFMLDAHKTYRAGIKLGVNTDTGDAEGKVLAVKPTNGLLKTQVQAVLTQMQGTMEQIPPMYSALKYQGMPLYKLARQGISIGRKARTIKISSNKLLAFEDDYLELEIICSKGTYIRTIATDIGEMLGCGAHLCSLRRTAVNHYTEHQAISLAELEAAREASPEALSDYLQPLESLIPGWPEIRLCTLQAERLIQGMSVVLTTAVTTDWVRIVWQNDNKTTYLGIGQITPDKRLLPKRLISDVTSTLKSKEHDDHLSV